MINWSNRCRLCLIKLIRKLLDKISLLQRKVLNKLSTFIIKLLLIIGLLQKLDKCIEALIKKMADKNDTKKALLFLEKRINDYGGCNSRL